MTRSMAKPMVAGVLLCMLLPIGGACTLDVYLGEERPADSGPDIDSRPIDATVFDSAAVDAGGPDAAQNCDPMDPNCACDPADPNCCTPGDPNCACDPMDPNCNTGCEPGSPNCPCDPNDPLCADAGP